jgi:hypothetical protein
VLQSRFSGSTLSGMNATNLQEVPKYPVPFRISLEQVLEVAREFSDAHRGKTRALALWGALFDSIAIHFHLFAKVNRARLRKRGQHELNPVDLECLNEQGVVVLALELRKRRASFADVQDTVIHTRNRDIREVFFTAPKVDASDADQINSRIATAFAGGQNLYIADFFDLAKAVLALGGEPMRVLFLRKVGEHLDTWNTQPSHRQTWKRLLQTI